MGRYSGKNCRLLTMIWMTAAFFLVEITVGYATNSMALVADSFHMLSDITALLITFVSLKVAPKSWSKNSFGCARAEVLGALINAVFLAALCFSITIEAVKRFVNSQEILEPQLVLFVGAVGFFVNVIGMFLFHEHGGHGHSHKSPSTIIDIDKINDEGKKFIEKSTNVIIQPIKHENSNSNHLNMQGIFLHVMADALGSVIVVISASVVWLTDWKYKFYLDPALSLVLVVIIAHSLWPLLRDSSMILLQTAPSNMHFKNMEKNLANIEGVMSVHDFHLWQLTGEKVIASAHIRCRDVMEYMEIAEKIKTFFHNQGVHSITIQPEFPKNCDDSPQLCAAKHCLLPCPDKNELCKTAMCCDLVKSENGIVC